MFTEKSLILNDEAVLAMLRAGVDKARVLGQPQCIVIVDASGVTLGQIRMRGAKFLSLKSAQSKARTAASLRSASDSIPEGVALSIAAATGNAVTALGGGMPIVIEGICVGGIGVGSGTAVQDKEVASAALSAIGVQQI